jgi:Polyketide cyclase / dehydrase and lipid transport
MRWILSIVAAVALLAIVVAVAGAMLPKQHTASRTARVALPPEALYALIADVSRYPTWRAGLKSLERLPDKNGMPAWIEDTSGTKIPMRFERMEPPSLLVGRIDSTALAFGGTWTYRIAPAGGGSDLTITEDGEVYNVIFRFMARFVFGYHATMDAYLRGLQAHVTKR